MLELFGLGVEVLTRKDLDSAIGAGDMDGKDMDGKAWTEALERHAPSSVCEKGFIFPCSSHTKRFR